ncbi:MAG: family 1 encapsulin nanocompartment shell protein [Gemmatimonadaceae bacterium]
MDDSNRSDEMAHDDSQVKWTDEQWARVRQVVQEEARRARVAATFLPLYGPLPPDTDFVPADVLAYESEPGRPQRMTIDDTTTKQLATLQVRVFVRGAQMADPALASVLQLFRRAANVLARLEDAVIFGGEPAPVNGKVRTTGLAGLPPIWEILGGQKSKGLLEGAGLYKTAPGKSKARGEKLVGVVSESISELEAHGHLGPFVVVLGDDLFTAVQTPNESSLVLPQDRIIPFLGGGSLLRTSTLDPQNGVVVALGGAPVDLVVATDVSVNFLQVTTDPMFVFRVFEKIVLRIKEPEAIVALKPAAAQK